MPPPSIRMPGIGTMLQQLHEQRARREREDVRVTLTGTPGTSVPAGTLVTTSDGRVLALAHAVSFPSGGSMAVVLRPTQRADVLAFQKAKGLPPDGILGPRTKARVGTPWAPNRYALIMADEDWWS